MRRGTMAAGLVLVFLAGALAMSWLNARTAWARLEQTRMMGILNAAGDDTILLQDGVAVGMPVVIVSGGAAGVWTSSQNKTLAQCGGGACPGAGCTALDSATSVSVLIKPDENATDNVWCDVDSSVDVDNGVRVGKNGEGIGAGITDPSNIVCCGEGSATFKISVEVES